MLSFDENKFVLSSKNETDDRQGKVGLKAYHWYEIILFIVNDTFSKPWLNIETFCIHATKYKHSCETQSCCDCEPMPVHFLF